ncbi:MAG TPA: prepilin-type N-terminal cleavage/methylation domain-containing protein [Verrucomicrobiae bacterium]|jgi:prepilin-type N-terminal cleavage/methylation domain-containing protein
MKIKLHQRMRGGFSLLEVMIAIGIFFIGSFGILQVVSQSLSNARRLQHPLVDASAVLSQWSLTNALVEGEYSGDLEDLLGKNYAGYTWKGDITEVRSNKLFSADFYIFDNKNNQVPIARTSTFFFRPQSKPGSLDGGTFTH